MIDWGPAPIVDVSTRRAIGAAIDAEHISLATALDAMDRLKWNEGNFVPANGRTETPFKFEHQTYLYCWHTGVGEHRYIHMESDMPMPKDWYPGKQRR